MKVKVAASSANLGPGFDCFGLAWQLYNTIEFLPSKSLIIEGCDDKYKNTDNLCYLAYCAALKRAGRPAVPVRISFLGSDIPVSRGLGSSAALIVAGVLGANELWALGLSEEELFSVATRVEGHPDNIAPALFGGLTVSAMEGEKAFSAGFSLSDKFSFTALVPDFELSTAMARSVLPDKVLRADAIFNVSRAALLLKALENGDERLLSLALQDKLHQPYRERLISGYDLAKDTSMSCGGAGLCISGAGSTLLCISVGDITDKLKSAMVSVLPSWSVLPLKVDVEGARLIP